MAITITLNPDAEAKLRQRADAEHQDVSTYVARILREFADAPDGVGGMPETARGNGAAAAQNENGSQKANAAATPAAQGVRTNGIPPGPGPNEVSRRQLAAIEAFAEAMSKATAGRLPPGHRVDDDRESIYGNRGE